MNGQWADVYTQEQVDLLWGPDGMGYNIMRIRINPDESNWKSYVNAVKWAKAHGATVFASPWTLSSTPSGLHTSRRLRADTAFRYAMTEATLYQESADRHQRTDVSGTPRKQQHNTEC